MANKTLNQVISLFTEVATKHKQINHFYFGSFLSAMKEENITYPLLVVDTITGNLDRNQSTFNLIISVCDKVYKDHDSMNEVQSDTFSILEDIRNLMESDKWKAFSNVTGTSSANKFVDNYIDEVSGWAMQMALQITSKKDLCALPLDNYDLGGSYTNPCDAVAGCDDGIVNVNKSDSTLIFSVNVASGATENYNVGDSNVSNSDDTYTVNVKATENLELPDITHTDSDGSSVILPAQTPFVATLCSGGAKRSSELFKTGQVTSYATSDDGDLELGNGVDFYTLSENNPFGNAARFTDFSGVDWNGVGSPTGNLVIDWATADYVNDKVLVYSKLALASATWSNQITAAQTAPAGEPTTGWHLLNVREALNIVDYEMADTPSFFNSYAGGDAWLSTTNPNTTANAMQIVNEFIMTQAAKTNTRGGRQARIYTFTEIGV